MKRFTALGIMLSLCFLYLLAQDPSDGLPEIFLPEIISTGLNEHSGFDISPSGNYALLTISLNGHKIIMESRSRNGSWGDVEVAPFSGQYRDEYHFFSPDGQRVYFNSYRPDDGADSIPTHFSHWMVEVTKDGWPAPYRNKQWHQELWPYSMSNDLTVYGWASLDSSRKDSDIYCQRKVGNRYLQPERIGDHINTEAVEYCPCISLDGTFMVFCRMGTNDSDGLYISFQDEKGHWSKATRLPVTINTDQAERFPKVSPDNLFLYFNRQCFKYQSSSVKRLDYEEIKNISVSKPYNRSGDIFYVALDTGSLLNHAPKH